MKKKLIGSFIVFLSILSLTACGKKEEEAQSLAYDALNQKIDEFSTLQESRNQEISDSLSQVNVILADLQQQVDTISGCVQQNRDDEEVKVYPAYYDKDDYLSQKIKVIEKHAIDIGEDGDAFIFITDYHYERNAGNSVKLMSYLVDTIPSLKGRVVFGGDILNTYTPEAAKEVLRKFKRDFEPFEPIYVFGNHDMNSANANYKETALRYEDVYQIIGVENKNRFQAEDGKWYFTVDFPEKQIRYIVLDTGTQYSIGPETGKNIEYRHEVDQREWLLNVLEETPDGWNVGVLAHAIFDSKSFEILNNANTHLIQLLDAANRHLSYTLEGEEWDFSNKNINIMFLLSGHVHRDIEDIEMASFPIMSTTADCYLKTSGTEQVAAGNRNTFAYGTKDEQAFDVVQIDKKNRILYFTRIGYGVDRVFSY